MRRFLVAGVAILALAAILFMAYAAYDYTETACYAEMHKSGLDRETAEIFDTVGTILTGLQQGSYGVERWPNDDFQKALNDALDVVKDGRAAVKARKGLSAVGALSDLLPQLARAKSLATNRVNDIMRIQNPGSPDEYEKLRLEGRNLVATVKQVDSALEAVVRRTKRLPGICEW